MKANELMIGDWVYLNYWDGKYTQQIHGINYHSWRGEGYSDWVDTEIDDEASINNIEPIPLTAEILEKNGFEEKEIDDPQDGLCLMFSLLGGVISIIWRDSYDTMTAAGTEDFVTELWRVELWGNGSYVNMANNHIYVHELQHALRLCGLTDLADNFKV